MPSTATPLGCLRPLIGSVVGLGEPAASLYTGPSLLARKTDPPLSTVTADPTEKDANGSGVGDPAGAVGGADDVGELACVAVEVWRPPDEVVTARMTTRTAITAAAAPAASAILVFLVSPRAGGG